MSAEQIPYGPAIRNAIASKDLKTMKAVAAQSQKHIREVESALKSLLTTIEKMEKK